MAHDFYDLSLEKQLTYYDDGYTVRETIGKVLELAKAVQVLYGVDGDLATDMNENLIWLGVAASTTSDATFPVPVFGFQSVMRLGFRQQSRPKLWELLKTVQLEVYGETTAHCMSLLDLDRHWDGIYERGDFPDTDVSMGIEMLFTAVQEREMQSYERKRMDYSEFLETAYWSRRHLDVSLDFGWRCALCNVKSPLQVHHRTYERRGHEFDRDLIPLCKECHRAFHDNRQLA